MKPTVRNGVLTYTHQAVIDEILANPLIERKELAEKFGVSENWMKKVINSDAFQTVLDKRREQIVNPIISQTVQERLRRVSISPAFLSFYVTKLTISISIIINIISNTDFNSLKISLYPGHVKSIGINTFLHPILTYPFLRFSR